MAIDKGKLVEKMKGMSEEEKGLFLEAVSEAFPKSPEETSEVLSGEEIKSIREILAGSKKRGEKKKGFLETLDSLLER